MVHLLRYIRDNNKLGLKYYANIDNSYISDLFTQARIKTENQLIMFSDSIWQDWTYTGRCTGAYIMFYQVGPIDHCTHVPGLVSWSISEIEYNEAFTAIMALESSRMLNN